VKKGERKIEAARATGAGRDAVRKPSPAAWTVIAVLAVTALLLYTGARTGEWRGVVVTEVQILVVGLATWLVVRSGDEPD